MKLPGNRRLAALVAAVVLLLSVVVIVASTSGGSHPPYVPSGSAVSVLAPPPPSPAARPPAHLPPFHPSPVAVSVAAGLTLARQVAQLFLVSVQGKTAADAAALGSADWGGVVFDSSNFETDAQLSALAGQVVAQDRAAGNLAPLLAVVQEGGANRALPDVPPAAQPSVGASGRPGQARDQALLAGKTLHALGFNMTLAPVADVDVSGGALSDRLFSSSPRTVARMSVAAVSGYLESGTIPAVGHFPGSGAASTDPDQMPATVGGSLAELRSRDLVPFAALVAQAPVIEMSNASYAAFDGVTPASVEPAAVRLLRHDYDFQGVVMSDDLDASLQSTGQDPGSAAVAALGAGDDLLFISGPASERQAAYAALLSAATRSASLRARVKDALVRDLSLKARFGILH